jgi:metal-sulfur cluster biosynthetic enzyme
MRASVALLLLILGLVEAFQTPFVRSGRRSAGLPALARRAGRSVPSLRHPATPRRATASLRISAAAAIDPEVFVKQSEVLAALSMVQDPSRGETVTSLGAVKELEIDKDTGAVSFNVELGAPDLKGEVKAKCEEFVGLLPWVKSVRYEAVQTIRPTCAIHERGTDEGARR